MPSRGQTITVTFTAWDNTNNVGKTGDAANFTLRWVKDGTSAVPTNVPATEVDSTNCPGLYKIVLTGTECTCDFGALAGKSSTSGISIIPTCVAFEQLPTAGPGVSNGLLILGSNVGGITITNASGNAVSFAGGATGAGFLSTGGASGNGISVVGGSFLGYPVHLSHTSTTDGSDVFGQLGPNVLDLVHLVAPAGTATEFIEAMTQLYYRYFPPPPFGEVFKSTSDHTIRTRDSGGNVITTQNYSDDGVGNESIGPPS